MLYLFFNLCNAFICNIYSLIFSPDVKPKPVRVARPEVGLEPGYRYDRSCVTKAGEACVFPFVYRSVTYWSCTSERRDGSSGPWCPTQVTSAGTWQNNHGDWITPDGRGDVGWGACYPHRCTEKTQGKVANIVGQICIKFEYQRLFL